MNTTELKKFATQARNILKAGVAFRIKSMGFDEEGRVPEEKRPQLIQNGTIFNGMVLRGETFFYKWNALLGRIEAKGIQEVYEEAAYSWFNRLVAIRILERNGIIPVLLDYSDSNSRIPMIVAEARRGNIIPSLSQSQKEELSILMDDDNKTAEQFRLLISAFCQSNPILSSCFGGITDYTEMLLPTNILAGGGFIDMLNNTSFIQEDDYRQTELIGWLYQFYIAEKKDEVFASFKSNRKAGANEIPAATQIFTPNWIVKYMVENTIGRIYLDKETDSSLKGKMKYLVEPASPTLEEAKCRFDRLEDLTCADLSCGSGHIIGEMFNLLFDMYIMEGYQPSQAVENIFRYNITGIDIDTRAKQLSMFALLLKACQRDLSFSDAHCLPNVLDMPSPWKDEERLCKALDDFFRGTDKTCRERIIEAFNLLKDADVLGSLMIFDFEQGDLLLFRQTVDYWSSQIGYSDDIAALIHSFKVILALSTKYAAICMNPPYMGSGNMNSILSEYVKDNYEDGKADLFASFMILSSNHLMNKGKYGMINMQSWMFLSSFEKLRTAILSCQHIESLLHLGPRTFDELSGEVVQNATFVISKYKKELLKGTYFRLIDGDNCKSKELKFIAALNKLNGYYYEIVQSIFESIPGMVIGYWGGKSLSWFKSFDGLQQYADPRSGISTGDNERFYRFWYECDKTSLSTNHVDTPFNSDYKWFKIIRGGTFRKWYGCCDNVINLANSCYEIKNSGLNHRLRTKEYYNRKGITWNRIAGSKESFRIKTVEVNFGENSPCMFVDNDDIEVLLAFLNTKICSFYLSIINPTLSYQVADILKLPVNLNVKYDSIKRIVIDNIDIEKLDWDVHETSWDFKGNELIRMQNNCGEDCACIDMLMSDNDADGFEDVPINGNLISDCLKAYINEWNRHFNKLRFNESEINRQFIEIYGLQDELTLDVPLDEITILQQGEISIGKGEIVWHKDNIIKQFISYAFGVWMGRYRLGKDGLHIAHPNPTEEELSDYKYNGEFVKIDADAIIPLLPSDAPFADNACRRFVEFVKLVFGEKNLSKNLNFVNECLEEPLEVYLQKRFWSEHCKMYQKKPIYWLFSSEKGAFQCLAYMHRMSKYTVDQIRTNYLMPYIEYLKSSVNGMQQNVANLTSSERKKLDRYQKDLNECVQYDIKLHDIANRMIEFDLDDGVANNYKLFEGVVAKIK